LADIIEIAIIIVAIPLLILISLLAEGVDRKFYARMQRRIGPPIMQPIYDFIKLAGKERIVPSTARRAVFITAPYVAFLFSISALTIPVVTLILGVNFTGDLILIAYMIVAVTLMFIIGGAASGNPYSSIGMSRTIMMMIAYEIPVLASLIIVAVKSGLTLGIFDVIAIQTKNSLPFALIYPSITLVAAAFLFCIPAAAEAQPFDIPTAKTEIIHGALTEYTGLYLALFKLAKANHVLLLNILTVILFFYPVFIPLEMDWLALIVILILALIIRFFTVTIPRAIFARLRVTQALKLYWFVAGILLVFSIILIGVGV